MASPEFLAATSLVLLSGAGLVATYVLDRRRATLRTRLRALGGIEQQEDNPISLRRRQRVQRFRFLPAEMVAWLESEFAAAGGQTGPFMLGLVAVVAFALTASFVLGVLGARLVFAITLAVAVAVAAPIMLLRRAQRRYQQRFIDAFPDALDLIVRGVRAGLSILDAVAVAGEEIPAPVGSELRHALDQMRIGVDMDEALQHAADRIRVPDFWFFAVSLALQRRTGGALAETLANLSDTLRRRKEIRTKTRALIAESRTSMIILASLPIFVAVLLYFISRDNMATLVIDPRGRMLLGIAVLLLLSGIFTMAALVKRTVR